LLRPKVMAGIELTFFVIHRIIKYPSIGVLAFYSSKYTDAKRQL